MKNLRTGNIDVLIGVNLLREGLDLPEVSLVAIMDADKEGFLRSKKSLIQTIGRSARHINGTAILYADKITSVSVSVVNKYPLTTNSFLSSLWLKISPLKEIKQLCFLKGRCIFFFDTIESLVFPKRIFFPKYFPL